MSDEATYSYLGADTNPTGFTNNWLESRKATHYFDHAYADFALYEEHRAPPAQGVNGNYDTPYNDSYRDIVKTMVERTPLSDMFFSHENMKHLKVIICRSIYQQSGGKYNPSPEAQSDNELLLVMRSIFLNHSRHLPDRLREQVAELNFLVMNDMVPRAISNAQLQLSYIRDSTQQPLAMDVPRNVSSAGTRSNQSVTTKFV
jgi:hypothetical protein